MTSQFLRREPADTVCFLDKRSNRSLHHSSNFFHCSSMSLLLRWLSKLAAGERFERPYPDSKSRVLPLDDPASHCQRYRFYAAHAQHRRFIDVVAEPSAISPSPIHQLAVVSSAIAVEFRRKLYLKAFEFNYLCAHNSVAARRIEFPSQP